MERTYDEEILKRINCLSFVKGPVCRWNVQKMRSKWSEYVRKTTAGFFTNSWRIKIALESYFDQHAQEG